MVLGTFLFGIVVCAIVLISCLKIIPPTHRGLVERFGKYNRFAEPGLHMIIPFIEHLRRVNVTEQMVDAERQEVITNDNLNAGVDAQVYFRVKSGESDVMKSQYNVDDYIHQIVNLARTTLRDIIGKLDFKTVNSQREELNTKLQGELDSQTESWGIEVVRTELKEIEPPHDVQETMNEILKAENTKDAARDYATAEETKADGFKRASIKKAEGLKRARILEAEGVKESKILEADGEAQAIKTVHAAADKYFVGNAKALKALETVTEALSKNTKIVLPEGKSLVNVIGDLAGTKVIPIEEEKE